MKKLLGITLGILTAIGGFVDIGDLVANAETGARFRFGLAWVALSTGYCIGQYFGWQWGKFVRPREAARFHVIVLVAVLAGVLFIMAGVDPVKVTEYSIVLSAAALPLTYFPILVVSNDPAYTGDKTNGPVLNTIATFYLVLIVVVAAATIPLMIITKGGT